MNAGIHPHELPRQLLLSEHREITRIPNAIRSGRAKIKGIPKQFKLGKGHVKFFYDKLGYLKNRYGSLLAECKRRGYNVTDKSSAFDELPPNLMNDYLASLNDRQLIIQRFESRNFSLLNSDPCLNSESINARE